jgi:hypothetical protein
VYFQVLRRPAGAGGEALAVGAGSLMALTRGGSG